MLDRGGRDGRGEAVGRCAMAGIPLPSQSAALCGNARGRRPLRGAVGTLEVAMRTLVVDLAHGIERPEAKRRVVCGHCANCAVLLASLLFVPRRENLEHVSIFSIVPRYLRLRPLCQVCRALNVFAICVVPWASGACANCANCALPLASVPIVPIVPWPRHN